MVYSNTRTDFLPFVISKISQNYLSYCSCINDTIAIPNCMRDTATNDKKSVCVFE